MKNVSIFLMVEVTPIRGQFLLDPFNLTSIGDLGSSVISSFFLHYQNLPYVCFFFKHKQQTMLYKIYSKHKQNNDLFSLDSTFYSSHNFISLFLSTANFFERCICTFSFYILFQLKTSLMWLQSPTNYILPTWRLENQLYRQLRW